MKLRVLVVAALALGVALTPCFSQDRPRPEGFRHRMEERLVRALALTDAQKASYMEIRSKHQASLETKRQAAEAAQKAFTAAMKNPDAKVEDLKALHTTQADANLDLLLEHRALRAEIRAILTPEQREKAARLEGRMEGRMMGHWGGHGGPR